MIVPVVVPVVDPVVAVVVPGVVFSGLPPTKLGATGGT